MGGSTGEVGLELEIWPTRAGALTFPRLDRVPVGRRIEVLMSGVAPGSRVVIDDQVVRLGLLARGAKEVRHLHTMRHHLREVPRVEPIHGLNLRSWASKDAEGLAPALVAAYGPDHPDPAGPDVDEATTSLAHMTDDPDNPVMENATQVALLDGKSVGAALVLRSEHVLPWKGPWLMNMFRSPDLAVPGIGAAMLTRALENLKVDGEPHLGLAVTSSNPARRVYERLGFEYDSEMWVVVIGEAKG